MYLQRTEPPWYARLWYPLRYSNNVRVYASQDHVDPALLAAVIETESKFDATARSNAGAAQYVITRRRDRTAIHFPNDKENRASE